MSAPFLQEMVRRRYSRQTEDVNRIILENVVYLNHGYNGERGMCFLARGS